MISKLPAAGLLALLLGLSAPALAQDAKAPAPTESSERTPRFAVLDTRQIILYSEEGLRVQANLRKLTEAKQADLATKDKALQDEQDALRKEEKAKGPSEALEKRKAEWRQKVAMIQQAQLEFQREMLQKEGELTKPMLQKIGAIVKTIAAKEGYELVVDKNAVVFFKNESDITDKVMSLYNQGDAGAAKKPEKPAPKPAPKK